MFSGFLKVFNGKSRSGTRTQAPNFCPFTDLCRGNERAEWRTAFPQFHRNFAESFKLNPGCPDHIHGPLQFTLSSQLRVKSTSPKAWSAKETEKNVFLTFHRPLQHPPTDSAPRGEPEGLETSRPTTLTAQQALSGASSPPGISLCTAGFLPDRKAASSHPEIKKQHATKPKPSRALRTAAARLGRVPSRAEVGGDGGVKWGRRRLPQPGPGQWVSPLSICTAALSRSGPWPGRDAEEEAGNRPEGRKAQGLRVPAHRSWPRSPAKLGQKDTRVSELRIENSLGCSDQVKPEPRPLGRHPWPPLSGHLDLSAPLYCSVLSLSPSPSSPPQVQSVVGSSTVLPKVLYPHPSPGGLCCCC